MKTLKEAYSHILIAIKILKEKNENQSRFGLFEVHQIKLVSLDELKFMFYQVEMRLEDSNRNFDSTTNKTIALMTFTLTVFSALVSYFYLNIDLYGSFSPKLCTVLIVAIYMFFVLIYLIQNILPIKYIPIGTPASQLLTNKFYEKKKIDENTTLKRIYYDQLSHYEDRLNINSKVNETRLNRTLWTVCHLIAFPVIGLSLYLLLVFLPFLCTFISTLLLV